jgi:hypothetical protein
VPETCRELKNRINKSNKSGASSWFSARNIARCTGNKTLKKILVNYITVFRNRCILNGSCCRKSLFKLAKVNKKKHVFFKILCHDEDLHCVSTAKFVIRIANVSSDWIDFHMHVYWPKYHLYTTSGSHIICLNTPHRQFYVCSVQRYLPFRVSFLDIAADSYGYHSPNCLLINTSHKFPNWIPQPKLPFDKYESQISKMYYFTGYLWNENAWNLIDIVC